MNLPILRLNPKADYRLRNGHLWIYSNEIDPKFLALQNLEPGTEANITNAAGKFLGVAYVNPQPLICARLISTTQDQGLDFNIFKQRFDAALALRTRLFNQPCYRLIYGESDFLPGLVIDRFFDTVVVQIATAGMERHVATIVAVLEQVLQPTNIILKNDSKMRAVEGLPEYVTVLKGNTEAVILLEENGVKFSVPIITGQKTGWFYDHRLARARLKDYVRGKRVLDVFSYIGGWGIQAAACGATQALCTDVSKHALEQVKTNAQLNDLSNVATLDGDAFEVMQKLFEQGEKFDVVIIDPPAFIPRRKDYHKGLAAYQKANLYAMRLLNHDGIIFSSSCSLHLPVADLQAALHLASNKLARKLQILEYATQGPDHPIHPAIPETGYLKTIIARVMC